MMKCQKRSIVFFLLVLACCTASADGRIAVLDFELKDITSLPYTPQERIRTASMKPLLEEALEKEGPYKLVHIGTSDQNYANAGFGYLFTFDDVAAKLGAQFNADWIVVSQHSKPSFLYSHLMVHVINVMTKGLIGNYDIELKGTDKKVTERSVKQLANKIHNTLAVGRRIGVFTSDRGNNE